MADNLNPIIAELADRGKLARPELISRIDRALAIIAAGLVADNGDGTYTVRSQSRDRSYLVNGHCNCPDGRGDYSIAAPDGYCKHRLAVGLIRRATALEAAQDAEAARLDAIVQAAHTELEDARQALSQAMRRWNAARRQQREALAEWQAGVTAPAPAAREPAQCPQCGAGVESVQQYIGGRGYVSFARCAAEPAHFAIAA